ncbi:MAG TPA: BMP family ABC transporter substrate-binding protein, partial [Candidatus Atribacteria bacterium]|nr:BMP family ABC transporter substrate-binding protein [Candidatus Atribacteria bacterium]
MSKWAWLLVLVVFFTLGSAALVFDPIPADDLKIGFVFVGPVGDGGWSYMHDQGRQ